MQRKKDNPSHIINFEDDSSWNELKKSVTPLAQKGKLTFISKTKQWEHSSSKPLCLDAFGSFKQQKIHHGDSLEKGNTSAIDKKNAQRLKKGDIAFDFTIDLHGYTVEQAWLRIKASILQAYNRQMRYMLVVTGQGWYSENRIGVLRAEFPKWMNHPEVRPYVLAFCHAQKKHGGEGAYYVQIKRKRQVRA